MRLWKLILTLMVLSLAVAGCAITPEAETQTSGAQQADYFQRSGRFALSVEKSNGERDAVQGGFVWHEQPHQILLDLNNPMGTVLARVVVDKQGSRLIYPSGEIEYAASPDALVAQLLGYELPVSGMKDWLRGQTGRGSITELKQEQGRVVYFSQDNWRVQLQRYDEKGPKLLQMNRTQATHAFSVRIVVDY